MSTTAAPVHCAGCAKEIDMAGGALLVGKSMYHHGCYPYRERAATLPREPASAPAADLAELVAGITDENRHDEVPVSAPAAETEGELLIEARCELVKALRRLAAVERERDEARAEVNRKTENIRDVTRRKRALAEPPTEDKTP